ncbi:hypothetical protein TNCV_1732681 [Trichonephila clavipes]|nr:hypothetical protein TNCV_1732681 [Trichonephila clavipes]
MYEWYWIALSELPRPYGMPTTTLRNMYNTGFIGLYCLHSHTGFQFSVNLSIPIHNYKQKKDLEKQHIQQGRRTTTSLLERSKWSLLLWCGVVRLPGEDGSLAKTVGVMSDERIQQYFRVARGNVNRFNVMCIEKPIYKLRVG